MKKLTMMFSIAAFAMTLGAAGCKKKAAEESKDPAMKTDEKTGSAMADVKKPDDKKADTVPLAAAVNGDLPAECGAYKAAMDKLMACDKAKAAAAPMKDAFDKSWAAFQATPASSRGTLGAACKAAADGVTTTLTSMGC